MIETFVKLLYGLLSAGESLYRAFRNLKDFFK